MTKPLPPSPESLYLSRQTRTLRQQADEWLMHLAATGHSPRTTEGYRERLLPFVAWCEARSIRYAAQVSLAALEAYQRWLCGYRRADGRGLTAGGQHARLSSIRMLFRWLLKRHVILYNPADQLTLPKADRPLPAQVLSEAETLQVLQSPDAGTPLGLRNRAILELFWSTGIRRAELAGLRLSDVDAARGAVYVRNGKGGKARVVPVGQRALAWLARYLDTVRPRLTQRYDSGHLFVSQRGTGLKPGTLTWLAGKSLRGRGSVDRPGACHLFRHSMATQMLENGADTRHIQAILGHEKLETTQVYTRVAIGHLQKVHEKTHPAERKRTRRKKADGPEQ
ncbi:site-specific tyrosine recombinase XerC [Pantoea cypripedii]|uniref:Recombinase XerD n=1 Tax=Pantoea cypripedii TaxID=55209 RepID=A0A6B9GFD9_PANCY|nr:site-specific tyrosine recombinase XerC [Pantoea cypripedii]QGY33067.1 recombinase XerD [Pantoea cypripedii]